MLVGYEIDDFVFSETVGKRGICNGVSVVNV